MVPSPRNQCTQAQAHIPQAMPVGHFILQSFPFLLVFKFYFLTSTLRDASTARGETVREPLQVSSCAVLTTRADICEVVPSFYGAQSHFSHDGFPVRTFALSYFLPRFLMFLSAICVKVCPCMCSLESRALTHAHIPNVRLYEHTHATVTNLVARGGWLACRTIDRIYIGKSCLVIPSVGRNPPTGWSLRWHGLERTDRRARRPIQEAETMMMVERQSRSKLFPSVV